MFVQFERFVDNVIDLSPEAQMNEFLQVGVPNTACSWALKDWVDE